MNRMIQFIQKHEKKYSENIEIDLKNPKSIKFHNYFQESFQKIVRTVQKVNGLADRKNACELCTVKVL